MKKIIFLLLLFVTYGSATYAQYPELETDDIKEFIEINSNDYTSGI